MPVLMSSEIAVVEHVAPVEKRAGLPLVRTGDLPSAEYRAGNARLRERAAAAERQLIDAGRGEPVRHARIRLPPARQRIEFVVVVQLVALVQARCSWR